MVKKLLISLIAVLCTSQLAHAVNTGGYWKLFQAPYGEQYVTVNTTGTTVTMNNTGVNKIYVDIFTNQKLYYSFQNRVPDTRDAYVLAGANFDSQTYVDKNEKYGLKAATATANVVIRRYYLVMP